MNRVYTFFEELFRTPTPICDECGTETTWMYTLYDGMSVRHECTECHEEGVRLS